MRIGLEVLKRLYCLEHIKIIKQDDESWILRGSFEINREPDETRRFMLLKRLVPRLSFFGFKQIAFLRNTTFIDLAVEKFSKSDFDRIKKKLWQRMGLYLSHKLERLLVPVALV